MEHNEYAKHNSSWIIRKFIAQNNVDALMAARLHLDGNRNFNPYDVIQIPDNILLNVGIAEIWTLVADLGGGVAYSNANAQIGVGDSAAAESPSDTTLTGPLIDYVTMEASYPQLSAQTLTFRGVFDGSTANNAWNEFAVANGDPGTTGINMNRKVSSQGVKANGQVWTLDLSITLT